jgi:hypothetical protein
LLAAAISFRLTGNGFDSVAWSAVLLLNPPELEGLAGSSVTAARTDAFPPVLFGTATFPVKWSTYPSNPRRVNTSAKAISAPQVVVFSRTSELFFASFLEFGFTVDSPVQIRRR